MKMPRRSGLILCLSASLWAADPTRNISDEYVRAIRANDLKSLAAMSKSGVADVRDRLDETPLHYAAVYGSAEAVRILLEAGADPNARNRAQATPLIYAAYSLEKTRLLVEKGGDVNAKESAGATPLWVAAGVEGNDKTVRYLIDKGADLKMLHSTGADFLMRAAGHEDVKTIRLLLDRGFDTHRADQSGETSLTEAVSCDSGDKARMLIEAGSNVNAFTTDAGSVKNGPIDAFGVTPLMFAATCGDTALASALLKTGAQVNALDHRHMTALMMAVAVDHASPETAGVLMAAGADVNIADRNSETALDWARKYRNPAVIAALEKAGAKGKGLPAAPVRPADYKPRAREAIDRASALLAKSNEVFFREGGGCVGCHHQPFAARAFGAVRAAGLPAEPRLRQILLDGLVAERARVLSRLPLMPAGGGGYDSFLYPIAGMADMAEPANSLTDAIVHYVAERQDVSGSWSGPGSRPPLQESSFARTMLAVYALKTYGWPARQAEFDGRIARARAWLLTARASTTVDEADRLMGLWIAGAKQTDLDGVSRTLLAAQKPDGGWAQTPYLDSDAFGTAAALYSLRKAGFLKVTDPVYRRGAQYLLETQFPDGSWYVRSRVVKLQPYFQSAFPFDHDQWISNSATAYAVMALAPVASR
ncbi:MAG TPA: ankyrin repeat domain-containing protein [Bryobacteraceae bacterium]|nr:ankyrin repeat domain-containing protein [Bryobacteraceae bacterium]